MKFHFVCIGRTKDKNWQALQGEYLRRLSHFVKCEVTEVKDAAPPDAVKIESQRILEVVNPKSFAVLLDVGGTSLTSHELAETIEKWQVQGQKKEVVFIIGGAGGVSGEVVERADYRLSLSFLTFTHEMARVLLLEQLYRAYTIIKGFPYQK